MPTIVLGADQRWTLPPLVLYPFGEALNSRQLSEASDASLKQAGLLARGEDSDEDLDRTLLAGRYCELRILHHIGSDLMQWITLCLDMAARDAVLRRWNLEPASFAALLTDKLPEAVEKKARSWGMTSCPVVFARALGIHSMFEQLPDFDVLSPDFIRNYHRFADRAFACWRELKPHLRVEPANFEFELYTSGEYAQLVERESGLSHRSAAC